MKEHRIVVIVSDLHMSDGGRRDDFICNASQFPRLLDELASKPGDSGQIELFINGDFLDFVQALPESYQLNSAKYWCSEAESMRKLEAILKGHPDVFAALRKFQEGGNAVTIVPGNHDIDLYWPKVQSRLRAAVGAVAIEPAQVWYSRFDGKLRIAHGNHIDPANRLEHWEQPLLMADYAVYRLEMCPGTLFVVKFVSWLEKSYPFANNLHPETKLAGLLAKGDRFGFVSAAWMLTTFATRHPVSILERGSPPKTGEHLVSAIHDDDAFAEAALPFYRKVRLQPEASLDAMRSDLTTQERVADFMLDCLTVMDVDTWLKLFDRAEPDTLDAAERSSETLAIRRSGALEKSDWSLEAMEQRKTGAEVVVMGHTHLPDRVEDGPFRYFNPGSWMRYVDSDDLKGLTLEDRKRENAFPYQLNYVRVEQRPDHTLHADMICFEEAKASFKPNPNA
jgi:UDP-2,3-diacylglucosamine pyrophosphatase LpxH